MKIIGGVIAGDVVAGLVTRMFVELAIAVI